MKEEKESCVVLVPHLGAIDAHCEASLRALEQEGYAVWRQSGYANIDMARNQMATDALADGYQQLMWVDSDVGFEPEDVCTLQCHSTPVVCGIYVKKGRGALACKLFKNQNDITFGEQGGLVEIRYAATGFLLTKREVYLTLAENLPKCNRQFGNTTIPFFQPMVIDEEDDDWYLGEDFAFCERLSRAGFKIFADTSIRLWHYGRYGYSWEDAGSKINRFGTYHYQIGEDPDQN